MPEEDGLNIIAELTVDSATINISIVSLTMTSCVARMTTKPKMYQLAILRLFEDKGEEELFTYSPIKITLETSSQKKSDPNAYYVNIKFNNMMKANQGIVQLMHARKERESSNDSPVIYTKNSSLSATPVQCHMCDQKRIPFWSLGTRTMETQTNIFGVPVYTSSMGDHDFCDYNLIRIVVCPKCYFSSNDIKDFKKTKSNGEFSRSPYDIGYVSEEWGETIANRKKLIAPLLGGFFSDERTEKQARLSYDLALITSDMMFKTEKDKDSRRRNYAPARKSVSYLLVNAELLIAIKQTEKAEKLLEKATIRLEKIFPYLSHEASIKVGFLLGMLNLYFEKYRKAGQFLAFLQGYNKDGEIEVGTSEYKVMMKASKKMNEAYQNRKDFSKFNLEGFKRPY